MEDYNMKNKTNGVKIGDVITAYHKGYHIVTGIIPRGQSMAIIQYRTVLDRSFTPKKGMSIKECDASYCNVWTKERILEEKAKQIEYFTKGCVILKEYTFDEVRKNVGTW